MKKVIRGIEYLVVRLIAAYVNSLPEQEALRFGATLGATACRLMRRRVSVLHENLKLCRIAFDSSAIRRLFAIRCFQHVGISAIEILRQKTYRSADFESKVTFENMGLLETAHKRGKGAILMSGHIGNWELLGSFVAREGYPTDLLVKRQSNQSVDELINSFRLNQGVGIIYTDTGSRDLIGAIRKGGFVAILADQYGGADSETVRFFGNDVLVPTGPAALIQKYDLPLVFGMLRRAKDGHHYGACRLVDGLSDRDRKAIVQEYTSLLEEAIRECPEMWLWTHRKFKNLSDYEGTVE
jgi:KDO2-lipid IV(A) lauroyltransferase